jgi:hypothetical protein
MIQRHRQRDSLPYGAVDQINSPRFKKPRGRSQLGRKKLSAWILAPIGIFLLVGFLVVEFGYLLVGCNIKGNINTNGERIYHIPGQKFYSATTIRWRYGERWFCSEEAARAAGWRKARI